MKKILKNKKICMTIVVVCVLILVAIIIGLVLNRDKSSVSNEEQDVIVHEADENTVEEIGEDGLFESDSEDGPVLSEDNMIDFNGSNTENGDSSTKDDADDDSNKNESDKAESDKDESSKDESGKDESGKDDSNKDDDAKDTGSWGAFY